MMRSEGVRIWLDYARERSLEVRQCNAVVRNAEIVRLWRDGSMPWWRIAEVVGVSMSTVTRAVRQHRADESQ
jgi:hypothetical protein